LLLLNEEEDEDEEKEEINPEFQRIISEFSNPTNTQVVI
jgi:hypothetical protein